MSTGTEVTGTGTTVTLTGFSASGVVGVTPNLGSGAGVVPQATGAVSVPAVLASAAGAVQALASPGPVALPATAAGTGQQPSTSTPAAFPSVLSASGRNIVDAGGFTMAPLKGLVMQPTGRAYGDYTAAAALGARIIRTVVFWAPSSVGGVLQGNGLQVSGPPASGTDFSGIDTTTYVPKLDLHIASCYQAGLYVLFTFYFSPQTTHMPAWAETVFNPGGTGGASVGPANALSNYAANGQAATNYLAQRYGDPSDPQGFWSGTGTSAWSTLGITPPGFQPVVAGMGMNELTPDHGVGPASNWLTTLVTQQATSMMTWMRTYAPNWIASICCGFGASAPMPNVTAAGQSSQTFEGIHGISADSIACTNALATAGGNYFLEMHDYELATTNGTDGRNNNGGSSTVLIKVDDTSAVTTAEDHTQYPPKTNNAFLARGPASTPGTCQACHVAYLAPYVAACQVSALNVPLVIGEFGWAPYDATVSTPVTFGTGANWIADKLAAWSNAGAVIMIEWDYQKNQNTDPWAANPGPPPGGVPPPYGSDGNGWQTVTNLFFA